MPLNKMKRHAILHTLSIPERKLRPLKWLALISYLLVILQLAIESLVISD
ncbi:hypothetical protein QE402_001405 [Klebsiella sp. SORGH_AS 1025]|nr:hypothetical protein [Klebsiella variicola]MDR6262092.1 hypothetical protein [Klebsiella sp. SORGH_AS_0826]MDR6344420.1 hypothetical protein [Klebsiella sp. SORGH_AS_1025]MDR6361756.1 hypothetical protein [Klebsiella sp. SORGH_AS_1173]MDR6254428.1 hypothetical protein [Klebsiella variicola]